MAVISTFDSTKGFLSQLLTDLGSGKVQLPDFQRGWVWDDDHIRSIIASIARSFPIGAVMMLETGSETRFQPRPVQGIQFPPDSRPQPDWLVLDGQQRLTSLYQATLLGRPVETVDARKQKVKRWYYIDIAKAASAASDLDDAILSVPESRQTITFGGKITDYSSHEKEYENGVFPLAKAYQATDWCHGFRHHWKYAEQKMKMLDHFEMSFLEVFKMYQVPLIVLRRETPKEAVCQVFEKVNTGGVTLTAFELLTATYAAEDFNLRDDWYGNRERQERGREARLHRLPVLANLQNTDFLQVVALLHTFAQRKADVAGGARVEAATAVSCKRSTILNLPLDAYRRWADEATVGFERAARLLYQQKVFSARDLPYQTQVVPLAAIMARLGGRWEEDGVRRLLARWFWCGIFGELYGSAIESRFARDVPEVLDWLDGGTESSTVTEANFSPGRLLTLRTRNSAAYKGLHALLMRDGGLDLRTGVPIDEAIYWDESIDIHHIFPRAWCERHGVGAERHNSIINKTAISATTNRIIGGDAPRLYVRRLKERYQLQDQRMAEILRSHLIEPGQLDGDDFETFFATRQACLLKRIEGAIGKPIVRGDGLHVQSDDQEWDEAEMDNAA